MIKVYYQSGQSRYSAQGVDYMFADADGIELYAEKLNDTCDETATFDDLKSEILEQAKAHGIDFKLLNFD